MWTYWLDLSFEPCCKHIFSCHRITELRKVTRIHTVIRTHLHTFHSVRPIFKCNFELFYYYDFLLQTSKSNSSAVAVQVEANLQEKLICVHLYFRKLKCWSKRQVRKVIYHAAFGLSVSDILKFRFLFVPLNDILRSLGVTFSLVAKYQNP